MKFLVPVYVPASFTKSYNCSIPPDSPCFKSKAHPYENVGISIIEFCCGTTVWQIINTEQHLHAKAKCVLPSLPSWCPCHQGGSEQTGQLHWSRPGWTRMECSIPEDHTSSSPVLYCGEMPQHRAWASTGPCCWHPERPGWYLLMKKINERTS